MREAANHSTAAAELYRAALQREGPLAHKGRARVAVRLNSLALVSDPTNAIPLLEHSNGP
jgi:hypothetical protein